MTGEEVVACVDVGTTATKVALMRRDGAVAASAASRAYPTITGPGGRVEQDPEQWWAATGEALRACSPQRFRVEALVLGGQMQDLIAVGVPAGEGERAGGSHEAPDDGSGTQERWGVLRPAILYADVRATQEAERVRAVVGARRWHQLTGNLQDASSLPAKLLWLQRHEPETYRRARVIFLGAHDYVTWRACGAVVTDPTTASTTGLLDLATRRWALDLLEAVGLRVDFLPRLAPPSAVVGALSREAGRHLGLPAGTPVVHGAGDAATTALGAGAGDPGPSFLYLGTSGWLARTSGGKRADPDTGVFTLAHPERGRTLLIGPMLTAAGNLEWIRRALGGPSYDELSELAGSAPPGSGGVVYLPYPAGERSPFRNAGARASFVGIHLATERAHLVRAVMEGVAFAFRTIAEAMGEPARSAEPLLVAGGGARSEVWCGIVAGVMGRPVHRLARAEDVGARGGAILGGIALGWFNSYRPAPGFFPVDRVFEPGADTPEYESSYRRFREVHPYLETKRGSMQ
ncbi:MAG: hypothetical protein IMX02_13290 [Limnochordaceae bacterium]|nr:hypothetical protein [Limnochordaceae bacterium]